MMGVAAAVWALEWFRGGTFIVEYWADRGKITKRVNGEVVAWEPGRG